MPVSSADPDRDVRLLKLTDSDLASRLERAVAEHGHLDSLRWEVEAYPSRAIVNACWRNWPVEDVQAGAASAYPLLQRRILPSEEHRLLRSCVGGFADAMLAVDVLVREVSERTWAERVLPFHLVPAWLVPSRWTLEGRSREVRLPGAEPRPRGRVQPSRRVEALAPTGRVGGRGRQVATVLARPGTRKTIELNESRSSSGCVGVDRSDMARTRTALRWRRGGR